jgi:hypothetical protein
MEQIDYDEFLQKIAVATIAVLQENPDDVNAVERISERSGFPVAHVRQVLGDVWGFQGTFGGGLMYTSFAMEKVFAASTSVRICRHEGSKNVVNVHGGTGVQAAAGGNVFGTQSITITGQDAFNALEQTIEASSLAPETKAEARSLLRRAWDLAGPTIVKTAIELSTKQLL